MNNKSKSKKREKPSVDISSGRVPPNSLEMEKALLCSCLINPDAFTRIVDLVDEDSFYDRRHGLAYSAMARLFSSNEPIDLLTVSENLQAKKELESAGGESYLAGLTGEVATSAHVEHYADVVRERASLRKLITSATTTALEAYDVADASELIDRAMQELFDIYGKRQKGGFRPIKPLLTDLHKHLDELGKRDNKNLTGVGTGFDNLDYMTSGFQPGELIIIAARPSMGKTSLALDIARHASQQHNKAVAFFSLEMASMAITMRLLAAQSRVDLHKLRSGKIPKAQAAKLSRATGKLSEIPFFIDDSGTLGIMEVRARARMLKQQHNIGIVFIDYLQLMKPPKADSREQEVAQISRSLKGLARELEIPVVALSQLSRAVENRGGDKRPQLADLRDSGAIEQDADLVMFIYRAKHYKSKEMGSGDNGNHPSQNSDESDDSGDDRISEVIIRKQRNGPTGTVKLVFNEEYASFDDMADSHAMRQSPVAEASYEEETDNAPF